MDRAGILAGMYDRRTYAASDEMIIKVTADGYRPEKLSAKAGEKLILVFTRVGDAGLGHCTRRDGK